VASRSGFDTTHHVALMDLIWAVRRIAFRHGVQSPIIWRPPKHAIYPDRYRPTKLRQRTRRPSHRRDNANYTACLGDPRLAGCDKIGRDEHQKSTTPPFKRLKIGTEGIGPNQVELPPRSEDSSKIHPERLRLVSTLSQLNFPTPHEAPHGSCANQDQAVPRLEQVELPSRPKDFSNIHPDRLQVFSTMHHDQKTTHTVITTPLPDQLGRSNTPSTQSSTTTTTTTSTQQSPDSTIVNLKTVSNTLHDNAEAVVKCMSVMRDLYGQDERLARESIHQELRQLRVIFDNCMRDAAAGWRNVENVIVHLARTEGQEGG
jgi:hypothetical protein